MEKVVKTGTLYKYHKSGIVRRGDNWKKCNAKLVETENDGLLILESESDKPVTYSLQSCSRVLEARNHYSKENAIELLFQKKVVQLGFDSPDESIEWQKLLSGYSQDSLSHINSATGNTKSRLPSDVANADSSSAEVMEYNVAYELDSTIPPLEVTVKPSPLAEKLNLRGKFFLAINNDKLTLYSAENRNITFSWEYKTIRKYGRDKKSFSMEVGRRSPTGPGVLVFNTVYGNDIFHRVQKNTIAINSQPATTAAAAVCNTNQMPSRNIPPEQPTTGKSRNSKEITKNNYHPSSGKPSMETAFSEYSTIEDPMAARGKRAKPVAPRRAEELEYCKANEITEDAWKTHGRVEENVHTEIYIGVQKPAISKKPSYRAESDLYGQIRKKTSSSKKGADLKESDPGVYASLGQSSVGQHLHHVPPQPSHPPENAYDRLARPMRNPSTSQSAVAPQSVADKVSENNSDYDHLQRSMNPPQTPQAGEELYNVIEQRRGSSADGRQRLVNLVDDGTGYMTNAGAVPSAPQESEYDMAVPHGYS